MKETTYAIKLNEILGASQFEARNGESGVLTVKREKVTKSSLHQLMKQEKLSEKISQDI